MKTTIEIADVLLRSAKEVAERQHTTVRALVEEGLRRVLKDRRAPGNFRLRDASVGGTAPSGDSPTWEEMRDLSYRGRGS